MATIEHFFVNHNLLENIIEAGSINDGENLSDHTPIYFKANLIKSKIKPEILEKPPRISWPFSTTVQRENYKRSLKEKIENLEMFNSLCDCDNVNCVSQMHKNQIDTSTENLLNCVIESAWSNLATTSGTTGDQSSRKFTIPGWNQNVKPFQIEAAFWRNLWISANKPMYSNTPGVEHDLYINMKKSRNNFHFAVRIAQKNINNINIIESCP